MIKRPPRLKEGAMERFRKKFRFRLVLCWRKQVFKENLPPTGWKKKLPPETPRQPQPIPPISAIFAPLSPYLASPSSEIFFFLMRRKKETEMEYLKRKRLFFYFFTFSLLFNHANFYIFFNFPFFLQLNLF